MIHTARPGQRPYAVAYGSFRQLQQGIRHGAGHPELASASGAARSGFFCAGQGRRHTPRAHNDEKCPGVLAASSASRLSLRTGIQRLVFLRCANLVRLSSEPASALTWGCVRNRGHLAPFRETEDTVPSVHRIRDLMSRVPICIVFGGSTILPTKGCLDNILYAASWAPPPNHARGWWDKKVGAPSTSTDPSELLADLGLNTRKSCRNDNIQTRNQIDK